MSAISRETGYSVSVIENFLKEPKTQNGLREIEKVKTRFVESFVSDLSNRKEDILLVIDRVLKGGGTVDAKTARDLKDVSLSVSHLLGNLAQLENAVSKREELKIKRREIELRELEYGKKSDLYDKLDTFEGFELTIKKQDRVLDTQTEIGNQEEYDD